MKEPELPPVVKKYIPRTRKSSTHLAIEWSIPRWIKLHDKLIVASWSSDPADLELRQIAKEIEEEILNIAPKTY